MGDGRPRNHVSVQARRTGPRRRSNVEVCLFDEFGEPVVLETLDLGPAGVFVKSDLVYDPGQELFVTLRLEGGPAFVLRGRVVRAQLGDGSGPAGMGIEFLGLGEREERWLRWYAGQGAGAVAHEPALSEVPSDLGQTARHFFP